MFTTKELKKLKKELIESLIKEAKKSLSQIPSKFKKKSEKLLNDYISSSSIAGLEVWLNAVAEYLYFEEAKRDIKTIQKSEESLENFQMAFTENLKKDFGVEDFRFIDWERTEPTYKNLMILMEEYANLAITPCYTLDTNVYLKSESNYTYYQKAVGDPSQKGVKIKTSRSKTPKEKIKQIEQAHEYLEIFWKDGYDLFKLLTDKIHIVQSNGLVSYSHFQEQGISYINFIDRDLLESIDDLIHENSHHHLNLILKKYKLIKKELKEDIFYSPWRKTLRPLYGIFHATFTFSYGALLFYNISKSAEWTFLNLDKQFLDRAYFRFVEETLYVEYSLFDLRWAIGKGYFTTKGIELIENLESYNRECILYLPNVLKMIKSKELKKEIQSIQKLLQNNRTKYKLM